MPLVPILVVLGSSKKWHYRVLYSVAVYDDDDNNNNNIIAVCLLCVLEKA